MRASVRVRPWWGGWVKQKGGVHVVQLYVVTAKSARMQHIIVFVIVSLLIQIAPIFINPTHKSYVQLLIVFFFSLKANS